MQKVFNFILNIKLVKFEDDNWGVRRGWALYEYRDLRDYAYWWPKNISSFQNCRGTKERAEEIYSNLTDAGTPVE